MLGKGIVAAVVRRHRHQGTGAVALQHVCRYPYRHIFAGHRVHCIRTREHACNLMSVALPFRLGAVARPFHIVLHLIALLGHGQLLYKFVFRTNGHEGDPEYCVWAGGEDVEGLAVLTGDAETDIGAFAASYPVALYLFQRVRPLHILKPLKQPFSVCRHTQYPLFHKFAFYREAAAH